MEVWRIFAYEETRYGGIDVNEIKELKMSEVRQAKKIISEKAGYLIKDKALLQCAFNRSKDIVKKNVRGNENLDFVGASILNFYVNKIIEKRYGYVLTDRDVKFNGDSLPVSKEKLKSISGIMESILGNENLSNIVDMWDLGKYLSSEIGIDDNVKDVHVIEKANLFKAIIGAIAIDCVRNQEILKNVIIKMLDIEKYFRQIDDLLEIPKNLTLENAIETLESILKKGNHSMPVYSCTDKEIYEIGGMRWFCSCHVEEWNITVGAYAKDKVLAKKYAAYAVICKRFGLENVYEPNVHGTIYKLKVAD